jgi:hypothetical protein
VHHMRDLGLSYRRTRRILQEFIDQGKIQKLPRCTRQPPPPKPAGLAAQRDREGRTFTHHSTIYWGGGGWCLKHDSVAGRRARRRGRQSWGER